VLIGEADDVHKKTQQSVMSFLLEYLRHFYLKDRRMTLPINVHEQSMENTRKHRKRGLRGSGVNGGHKAR
jgi:hypothetical protein